MVAHHHLAHEICRVSFVKVTEATAIEAGGSTLRGLAQHFLGITPRDTLAQHAVLNDSNKIDLTVCATLRVASGIVPAKTLASHFGTLQTDPSQADKTLGLVNMVGLPGPCLSPALVSIRRSS